MDVLQSEAIYQQEHRKSALLRVFQPQRGSMSFSQLFAKAKGPGKGKGAQSQPASAERSWDQAYIVRALCGGVESNVLKASTPKARSLTVNEAIGLVEQTAAQLTPELRERVLQTWSTILAADQGCMGASAGALSPSIKARHCWSSKTSSAEVEVPVTSVASPTAAAATATSKQQSGSEVAAVKSGADISVPSQSHHSTAPVLHLTLTEDNRPVEISFRELFLKSMALELVVKSFLEDPCTGTEEILLRQLLQLSLSREPAEQAPALVDAIVKLSSSMLHPHIQTLPRNMLRDIVSQAVGSLKAPADLGKLDRQMEEVQAQLAALLDEWNDCDTQDQAACGAGESSCTADLPPLVASMEPMQESMRWKIAQKAWQMASELKGLATQRHAILEHQAAYDYSTLRRMVDEPAASVGADVASLQQQLEETQSQLQQGAGFRNERFGKVKDQLVGMASEISGLEGRRTALLAELEQVEDDLRRLYKRQSELEEERNMFEEGSSLTLEGLTVQVSALEASQAVAVLESNTLQNASAVVALAATSAARAAASTLKESEDCRQAATDKVLAAAQRFCELQQLELSTCISTMKSCAAQLTDISSTQMYDDIMHEQALEAVEARRQAAIETYLDAEMAAMAIMGELAQVQDSVRIQYRSLSRRPTPAAPILSSTQLQEQDPQAQDPAAATAAAAAPTATSTTNAPATMPSPNAWPAQLAAVMPALDSFRAEFEAFDRPEEVAKYSMAKAISSISSRQLSASLSHMGRSTSGFSTAQLASHQGSFKLLGATTAADVSARLGREQSCDEPELAGTYGTDLISYTALMEDAADAADVRADGSRTPRSLASVGSVSGSKSTSPDRVAAAAGAAAAVRKEGLAGAQLRNSGSHDPRAGSDLGLQTWDNDPVAM